ncbi:MAG: LTA synthase family protein [Desulfobacteraceae bacterium]|nr:MAG: LTA synthase family protein [Desulfobacteraceae bacterium]
MNVHVKNMAGPLYPFLVYVLISISFLAVSRMGLSLWQFDRVSAADGWVPVMLQGLRVDMATIIMMVGVIAFLSVFLSGPGAVGRVWNKAVRAWLTLALMLLVFMELATPQFIIEYGFRPNRLFVEFLSYPKEVFSMLAKGHLPEMIICLAGLGVSFWGGWRLFGNAFRGIVHQGLGRRIVMALLILPLGLLGARSSLGHRPLNSAMVAFADDALVNSLPLNSFYSMADGIKQMVKESDGSKIYGRMEKEIIIRIIRKETGLPESAFTHPDFPTLHHQSATYRGKPKNLVIILEESLGARYVGTLGGLPLTPNLDALAKKSWLFEQLYATGTRSVRGIEAVISGFTPTPSLSVVKLGKSQHDFFTLADLLRRKGYFCEFIYGGQSHFDNMRSFFLGNGFHQVIEQKDFENPEFVASWGVSDEDLLNRAHQELLKHHAQGQPFFTLVFSSTNHDPFDFPEGRIELYEQPMQTRNNAAKYADYAIGRFFKLAESSPYWKDTVFLVVADHDSRVTGADLVPVSHFRIPGVIAGEGISQKRDSRLLSQIDLPPTLLSLMGVDNDNPMLGRDMTRQSDDYTGRAMMQYANTFAYMEGDLLTILQPHKKPQGFVFIRETQTLSRHDLDADLAQKALAHVLWGSLAYQEQLFQLPPQ